MVKEKLSNLYDIGSSKRVFQSEWREEGVPFYRAREIARLSEDGYVDNELFIDEDLYEEYTEKYGKPQPGDVMVTGVGTLGVCYVVKPEDKFYFKDGNILWFKQKAPDRILPEYLVKAFDSKEVKDFISKNSSGTTVGTFTIQTANKMEISLPTLNQQKEIIERISKLEGIIKKRQLEVEKLDELIKARFVELFGDPITNTKQLETTDLKDVLVLKAGDFTAASDISDEPTETHRYPCYGGNGIRGYVEDYNQEGEYSLIGRQGALSGNVQFAKGQFKNTEHALLVTPIIDMNSIWLNQLLLNLDLKRYQTGAAQPGLSVKNLQEIPIIVVPIEEQYYFAEFVEQVDKSKVVVKKSLDETKKLFDSLMQKYFGKG